MDVKISHSEQVAKSSFTKHLGVFHRRDAETAETSQRGGGKRLLMPSLRSLCVLCASAVNCSAVFLALLSFQIWPFSVKEFLATYLENAVYGIDSCEGGALRWAQAVDCRISMTISAGRRRTWARWRSGSRLRFTAPGIDQS